MVGLVSAYLPFESPIQIESALGAELRLKPDLTLAANKKEDEPKEGKAIVSIENSGLAIVQPVEFIQRLIEEYPHKQIGVEYSKDLLPEAWTRN